MSIDKNLQALAVLDLERNKDYYPADAMDKESCFYNGQIGNCGLECPTFINGKCTIEDEVIEECSLRDK
jgi:hypothetical protein